MLLARVFSFMKIVLKCFLVPQTCATIILLYQQKGHRRDGLATYEFQSLAFFSKCAGEIHFKIGLKTFLYMCRNEGN